MTRPTGAGAAMTLRLIRKETRGDLPLLVCLALLVLILTGLCAWAPVAAGRQEDRALRQRVAAQDPAPLVTLSTVPEVFGEASPNVDMATLLGDGRRLADRLTGSAARHLTFAGSGSYDYNKAALTSPPPPEPGITATKLALSHLPGAQAHLRYVSGHAPADRTPTGTAPQVGLSQTTARALGLRAGSRLTLEFDRVPAVQEAPPSVALQVSGVFREVAGADDFWSGQPTLAQPSRYPDQKSIGTVLAARGLVGTDTADLLARAGVSGPLVTWQLRPDLRQAALDRAHAMTGSLSHFGPDLNAALCQGVDWVTGDVGCHVGDQATGPLVVTDGLTPLLDAFTAQDRQARGLASFAVDSLAAVALATTAVAVRLLLRRRKEHLRLQGARGASTARLVLLRCAVAWPVVLVTALLGWAGGRHLAPTGTSGSPQQSAAAVAAGVVALTVAVMAWLAVREPSVPRRRRRRRRTALGGRRVVIEATVLLAAAAGVAALRSQGPDWVLGAVPAVVALAVVLILLRVYPLALRLLLRQARRGRGTVGFVGVARAAHDAPATGLALFVLVLTLGTAVFGGLVQRTVGDGLAAGAAWSTGADAGATVAGNTTPAPGALTGSTGMRTALEHLHSLDLVGQSDGAVISPVAVITVDPRQLVAVAPRSRLAGALLSAFPARPSSGAAAPLPSFVSPDLRAREAGGGFTTTVQADGKPPAHLTLDPVGTLSAEELHDPLLGPVTARIPAGTPILVTTASAEPLMSQAASGSTVLLLKGEGPDAPDPAALRSAAVKALGPLAQIRTRTQTLSTLREDGLTRGLGTIYTVSSVLAALLGLLAVALELILTSYERSRTTSFLRTLGLGGREAGAMLFLQLLPLAAASAVGGTLLGVFEPRLMEQALDLRQFTGGPAQPTLRTDYSLTLALVGGVIVLVLAAAATETALARRRRLGAVLRLA
ncbi:FtsX-like permease family protein [Streptomyces sp. NPDC049040]|uniref:FtsX-like permease family protein n=1 Tax=Streptomyces sp. NPDC049040 TaxID=3365593 RepID=UPI00371A5378